MTVRCLLKDMMSRLLQLDQGIIAFMKKAYTQYMMGELTAAMETSDSIMILAKKVTNFDAVLKMKVALDSVLEAVIKSLKQFGINGRHGNIPH